MSKYIGVAVAFAFFATWVYRKLRPTKRENLKTIPSGVSRWTYLTVAIVLFIGGILLPFGVGEIITEVRREIEWVKSNGFVTEHVASGTHRGRTTYRARFHYQTSKETGHIDHEVLDDTTTEHPLPVSTAIEVLYDPSNPDRAKIDSFQSRWLGAVLFVFFGAICLGYSLTTAYLVVRLQSLGKLARPNLNVGAGQGQLVGINKNFFLAHGNQPSWSLIVEYTDLANKKHSVRSEPIWEIPPDLWADPAVPVPLSIDRANSSRAWVRVQNYFHDCQKHAERDDSD